MINEDTCIMTHLFLSRKKMLALYFVPGSQLNISYVCARHHLLQYTEHTRTCFSLGINFNFLDVLKSV